MRNYVGARCRFRRRHLFRFRMQHSGSRLQSPLNYVASRRRAERMLVQWDLANLRTTKPYQLCSGRRLNVTSHRQQVIDINDDPDSLTCICQIFRPTTTSSEEVCTAGSGLKGCASAPTQCTYYRSRMGTWQKRLPWSHATQMGALYLQAIGEAYIFTSGRFGHPRTDPALHCIPQVVRYVRNSSIP